MELKHQIALVTGGTAGIGMESARLMAREGAEVIITGRDTERGQKAVAEIGGNVRFVQADMGDLASVSALVDQTGEVDIIVNNAATFPTIMTVDQDVTTFERMFDINVRGAYFLVSGLVPRMMARGHGSIVNITTIAVSRAMVGASVYSATKSALESLTRTWAAEFSSGGVRVNTVAPGPTRTEGALAEWGERVEDVGNSTIMKRTARPNEIAESVLFLVSPRSSYITGSVLQTDGGGSVAWPS